MAPVRLGVAAEKSGEISGEKVKPSTLIPAEGRQRARPLQTAVKFFNANAASEIKLGDGEAGRKSGTGRGLRLSFEGLCLLSDAQPYLRFLCFAAPSDRDGKSQPPP